MENSYFWIYIAPNFVGLSVFIGLDQTVQTNFLTGQDRIPKFARQFCQIRSKLDLYF